MTNSVTQQYSKKVSLLSQQTGKTNSSQLMAKKFSADKVSTRKNRKKY